MSSSDSDFSQWLSEIQNRRHQLLDQLIPEVDKEISAYRESKESYLIQMARQHDHVELVEENLWVSPEAIKVSHKLLTAEVREFIETLIKRSEKFESELRINDSESQDEAGMHWATQSRPLKTLGIYVPGSRSTFGSSLVPSAVPALMAGVKEITVATPARKKWGPPFVDPKVLYIAKMLHISKILVAGGTGAIAALAFGTSTTRSVDKIIGPGSFRTQTAKLRVSGYTGIDTFSGPVDIGLVCDKTSNPAQVAVEILARAERDPGSEFFICHSDPDWFRLLLDRMVQALERWGDGPDRSAVQLCLDRHLFCIATKNIAQSLQLMNDISPGVVWLNTHSAVDHLKAIDASGAVLVGPDSSLAFTDFFGGIVGVVPTTGAARFSHMATPADFSRRFASIELSTEVLERWSSSALKVFEAEGYKANQQVAFSKIGDSR